MLALNLGWLDAAGQVAAFFELNEVPEVASGVDSLLAFHEHVAEAATAADAAVPDPACTPGLAISISHSATRLVPRCTADAVGETVCSFAHEVPSTREELRG
ncbi:hypothetical protein GGF31_007576 [Allomyces arbusculus]|nr:hypothetical protein GGF31_007576 [Allomyces arbusculus]